jgi:D-glycero-D-manno-heptose 1,7-bisphosphate phosphatase
VGLAVDAFPAVFLDRDGVVNQNRSDYVLAWEHVRFLPGVFDALRALAASDFRIVMVTNQSPVGRGLLDLEVLQRINQGMIFEIEAAGGRVDGVYYCPHHPDQGCQCRKPKPGMLLQAAVELQLDLSRSYLVGDALSDVEAALAAGCQPLLVRTGRGAAQQTKLRAVHRRSVPVVADLAEAVAWILRHAQEGDLAG